MNKYVSIFFFFLSKSPGSGILYSMFKFLIVFEELLVYHGLEQKLFYKNELINMHLLNFAHERMWLCILIDFYHIISLECIKTFCRVAEMIEVNESNFSDHLIFFFFGCCW